MKNEDVRQILEYMHVDMNCFIEMK